VDLYSVEILFLSLRVVLTHLMVVGRSRGTAPDPHSSENAQMEGFCRNPPYGLAQPEEVDWQPIITEIYSALRELSSIIGWY
jgi:hypothetical protein